jgi:hypothetical protein
VVVRVVKAAEKVSFQGTSLEMKEIVGRDGASEEDGEQSDLEESSE